MCQISIWKLRNGWHHRSVMHLIQQHIDGSQLYLLLNVPQIAVDVRHHSLIINMPNRAHHNRLLRHHIFRRNLRLIPKEFRFILCLYLHYRRSGPGLSQSLNEQCSAWRKVKWYPSKQDTCHARLMVRWKPTQKWVENSDKLVAIASEFD